MKKALTALQEEAARQRVTVNTFVNQLLLDYSGFGRFVHHLVRVFHNSRILQCHVNYVSKLKQLVPTLNACGPRITVRSSDSWFTLWKKLRGVFRSLPNLL